MKIALVCRTYPSHRPGGMPHVIQDRAHALAKLGHDVHVWTTGIKGSQGKVFRDKGVRVEHLRCPAQEYTKVFADLCLKATRGNKPDVLHLDSFDRARVWWPKTAKKVVVTMHGFGPGAFLTQWNKQLHAGGKAPAWPAKAMHQERAALAKADLAIGISKHELWMLRDVYNLPRTALAYNPIPGYFFGATSQAKANAPWLVAGNPGTSGNRRFDIAARAAKAAGAGFKKAQGIPREKMPALIDSCRGLLLPTFWSQGYDLTVAEAMARGRPVISTATGSYYWEWSGPRSPVQLVPKGDVRAMAAAIKKAPLLVKQPKTHRPEVHAKRWLKVVRG